jgi:hypothetical protein
MYLTSDEERILRGEHGDSLRKAMEILVAMGKIYDADRLIPITSAHISGISYKNIGDAGLDFLKDFCKGVKVKVKTTINPGGIDFRRWKELGLDEMYVRKQWEIVDVFKEIGADIILSCTPYYAGNLPKEGDHISWSESSAVTYINSVVGAYSNRESGISALAAAVTGRTPNYGLHIKENREPKVRIKVKTKLSDASQYGVLGYIISRIVGNMIPYIEIDGEIDDISLKFLSASLATYGGIPMFHIPRVTPEWRDFTLPKESIEVSGEDFDKAMEYFIDDFDNVDIVWIGCPHVGLDEIRFIADFLEGRRVRSELWITTSRHIYRRAEEAGYISKIVEAGGRVITDTCVVVAPLGSRFKTLVTNSSKACYYTRGVNNYFVRVTSLKKCLETAIEGAWVE